MDPGENLKFRVVRDKSGGLELQEYRRIDDKTWAMVDRFGPFPEVEFRMLLSYLGSITKKH